MPLIKKRPLAFLDLAEIWSFIADDSERQADAFLTAMAEKLALIATQPSMGRKRDALMRGLRSFPVARYIVFYLPLVNGGIDVIRVLHSARDVSDIDFGMEDNA